MGIRFTKYHFERIADQIATEPNAARRRMLAEQFADMLAREHPNFKRHLFIARAMGSTADEYFNERPMMYGRQCPYCWQNEFADREGYVRHFRKHSGVEPLDYRGPFDHYNLFASTR